MKNLIPSNSAGKPFYKAKTIKGVDLLVACVNNEG